MDAPDLAYLEGFWTLTASAPQLQPASVSPEDADPSGTWEFMVLGENMTVYIGDRRYVGLISEAAEGWSYNGLVTGADAQGEMLSGYIDLSISHSDEGGFTGTLTRHVDASGETPAYTGTWEIVGRPQ